MLRYITSLAIVLEYFLFLVATKYIKRHYSKSAVPESKTSVRYQSTTKSSRILNCVNFCNFLSVLSKQNGNIVNWPRLREFLTRFGFCQLVFAALQKEYKMLR